MASLPVAYLLTWTCYGAWLHGDPRGSVDRDHNTPGEPFLPPNPTRAAAEHFRLRHPPIRLDAAARRVVEDTIERHISIRGWTLHAHAVRTNHVHVVVSCDIHADEAREQFKAWCTRRLREAGLFSRDTSIWTEKGSDRWLWDPGALASAIRYVADYQGDPLE
jgi:REP element-mobilizing transposase RayT